MQTVLNLRWAHMSEDALSAVAALSFEPAHDKIYNKTCVTSKDSGQPVHPPSMARILAYPSLVSLEAV